VWWPVTSLAAVTAQPWRAVAAVRSVAWVGARGLADRPKARGNCSLFYDRPIDVYQCRGPVLCFRAEQLFSGIEGDEEVGWKIGQIQQISCFFTAGVPD